MKKALHLDFKGIVPDYEHLCRWLDCFCQCEFELIFFEFDCRIPWRTFPGVTQDRLTMDEVKKLLKYCASIGLEAVPLIQVQGHLDWVLRYEQYAPLRENGQINELCPQHPESRKLAERWIDEVLELFAGTRYLHLGADEVWHLGECSLCQAKIAADPKKRGKAGIYLDHVVPLLEKVIARGVRPIIWADMFYRAERMDLAAALPRETILVDWQYAGAGPWATTAALEKSGLEVWGASAIQCGYYEHWWTTMNYPSMRLDNIAGWNAQSRPVIHTTWGRPGNIWNLYPSWHASYMLFVAAGSPERCQSHPWHKVWSRLSDVMFRNQPSELKAMIAEISTLPAENQIEKAALDFTMLSLAYQEMRQRYESVTYGRKCMAHSRDYVGFDPHFYKVYYQDPVPVLLADLAKWRKEVAAFFAENGLSDAEEFIVEKCAIFEDLEP